MLALQTDIDSEPDLFVAERFVYAVDHDPQASARSKQAADIMRSGMEGCWRTRPLRPSRKLPRESCVRLLLEPRLGSAPADDDKDHDLSWKSYSWRMQSVWLENILLHHPKRWLPEKYANYDDLLTAAVEAAVSAPDTPKNLASWNWGNFNPVEIQHPILGKIPFLRRWSGPGVAATIGQPIHGESGQPRPWAFRAIHRESRRPRPIHAQRSDRAGGEFSQPLLYGSMESMVRRIDIPLPFSAQAVAAAKAHTLVLEPQN